MSSGVASRDTGDCHGLTMITGRLCKQLANRLCGSFVREADHKS
jgi:hypothetical protein